jgi:O-antigen/teichoic acid export membrane protein
MFIRNSLWNILGVLLPTALSFPMLGYISREITIDEFGVFIFLFSLAGITTIFDFGFSRAVTREIAASNQSDYAIKTILNSSAPPMLGLIILTWVLFILLSPMMGVFINSQNLGETEKTSAFYLFACMTPLIILNQFLIGILEGLGKFYELSIQRIIGASVIVTLPATGVFLDQNLNSALYGILIGRFIYLSITLNSLVKFLTFSYEFFDKKLCIKISKYALVLSAGNFINTAVTQIDKFIVASKVGTSGLASYTTVCELLGKLTLLAHSVSRAIFPVLASSEHNNHLTIYRAAQNFIGFVAAVLSILLYWKAEYILILWLGEGIAKIASPILKIMSIGFFFNALAQIPFTKLQALGRVNVTTKLHFIEGIPYLIGLLWASSKWGIIGAATCWTIRMAIDWILLLLLSKRELN